MDLNVTEILDEIKDVQVWLNGLIGVDKVKVSRLPDIIKYIELYLTQYPRYEKRQIKELNHAEEMGVAISESISLITIKKGLSKYNINHLPRKKIRDSISGSFHPFNEKSEDATNQARNTLFELETAAYFLLCGANVIGFDDVNLQHSDWTLSIQCKRPMSWNNLRNNFKKASEQLVKNNQIQNRNSYGIIALSLEKLYHVAGIRQFKHENEFHQLINNINSDVTEKIVYYWQEYYQPNLIGLIYVFKFPIIFEERGLSFKFRSLVNFPLNTGLTSNSITEIQSYISNLKSFGW